MPIKEEQQLSWKAKSRAVCAYVPTWSTCQCAYVLASFTCGRVCVPAWFTCQRDVPKACQLLIFMCQRPNKRANVPYAMPMF